MRSEGERFYLVQELRFSPLFSGSSGNAIYVGCGNTHLLVDAGLSGARIIAELKRIGVAPEALTAILTTHEHVDHIRGVGILSRKLHIPVYATRGTWVGMQDKVGTIEDRFRCIMEAGQDFYLGDVNVAPFATPHDANEPVGLCFECGGARFAVATDLGCPKKGWMNCVRGADAVLLESNYDPAMLEAGPYPYPLKQRILSDIGHLSNTACSDAAVKLLDSGTVRFMLGHLSKQNNTPDLAYETTHSAFTIHGAKAGSDYLLGVAGDNGKAISF